MIINPENNPPTLKEREFAMHHTLENKVKGFKERIDENTFVFIVDGEIVHMHTFSKESEFEKFLGHKNINIKSLPDNDYTNKTKLAQKLLSRTVADQNQLDKKKRIIHGFILNQALTDFPQANKEKRINTIVNQVGFNKQILESNTHGGTFFDKRKLENAEIAIWALAHNLELEKDELEYYKKYKGIYLPKIDYFNINKEEGILESGWFRHITDPKKNRAENKYWFDSEHQTFEDWKKTKEYLRVVIPRNVSRTHKYLIIQDAFVNENDKYELTLSPIKKSYIKNHSSNPSYKFRTYRTARLKNVPFTKK